MIVTGMIAKRIFFILIFTFSFMFLQLTAQPAEETADSLLTVSEDLYKHGYYDSSVSVLQQALVQYKNLNNLDKQIESLNKLGRNMAFMGQMLKGHEYLDEAARMNNDRKNALLAETYHAKGLAYYFEANYTQALHLTKLGLYLRKELFGSDHESVAKSLNNLGILYEVIGELDSAYYVYQETIAILINLYGTEHIEIANMFNNFGTNAYMRGNYKEALDFYTLSLEMYLNLQGESAEVGNCYMNIGLVYTELNEYAKAREYTKQAENLYLSIFGENYYNLYTVYQNNGLIYKGLGEYDKALEYTGKAMDFVSAYYGDLHPLLGEFYLNKGVIYDEKKEYRIALEQYWKAYDLFKESEGIDEINIAQVYNNIGTTFTNLNEYDSAIFYYLRSLEIKELNLPDKHVSKSSSYHNLGLIYYYKKDYEKSLFFLQKAIINNHLHFSDTVPSSIPPIDGFFDLEYFFDILISKALVYYDYALNTDLRYLDHSIKHLNASIELLEKHVMAFANQEDLILFGRETSRMVEIAQKVYYKKFELSGDTRYVDTAFYFMERSKSAALLASLAEAEAKTFSGVPDSLIVFEDSLVFLISRLNKELSLYYESGAGDDDPNVIEITDSLFKVKRVYEDLIDHLNVEYPDFYNLKYDINIVRVDQLEEQYLKKNKRSALVEFFTAENDLYICVITSLNKTLIKLPIDEEFEKMIRAFRNSIIYNVQDQITIYAKKSYEMVMMQVDHYFEKENIRIRNIMIVPDGILGYIPFEAMILQNNQQGGIRESGRRAEYLVEKYNISYALSATVFYTQNSKPLLYSEKEYVAYAPVFTDGTNTNFLVNTTQRDLISPLYTRSFSRSNIISPIPATKDEVESIYGLYTGKNLFAEYFLFRDANEGAIKTEELGEFKYIHFATHGFVNDQYPDLSGLVLSQDSTLVEDGILFTGEIYGLNINAELVTLSACETGLGKLVKGEGIMGLTRGFMYAGARNVMVSLWKVADQSTSKLMIEFYNQLLSGNTKPESLAKAKRKLINGEKYTNPFYWAPFILIGF